MPFNSEARIGLDLTAQSIQSLTFACGHSSPNLCCSFTGIGAIHTGCSAFFDVRFGASLSVNASIEGAERKLVPIHRGAIPYELLEGELFGYFKDSFAGATSDRPGLVETAAGGTLFLDEIGELPAATPVKLLRFLADGSFQPVGAHASRIMDVSIVAATHRDLAACVADCSFREDLYYRLKVVVLHTPSLDERQSDVPCSPRFSRPRE